MNFRTAVASLLFAFPLSAHAQFEGVVETRNLSVDELGVPQRFTITMWIKRDRIRVHTGAVGSTPSTTMIYRTDRKIIWMINEEDRTYFEIMRDPAQGGGKASRNVDRGVSPDIKKTGKTKKILGYPCEQVVIRRESVETEIWGSTSLPVLTATTAKVLGPSDDDPNSDAIKELTSLGLYSLASTTKINGSIVETQETTRIDERPIDDKLFELPAGYRKVDIGSTN